MGKPVKRSVALVVRSPHNRREVLLVCRPDTPEEELRGVWGLPAASLQPGEREEEAARRVGTQKLGCHVRLVGVLGRGVQERPGYRLEMAVYEAELDPPIPDLPEPSQQGDVTFYTAWRFAPAAALKEAALQGSLCARVALDALRAEPP